MPEKNEFRTAEVFAQNVLVGEISETDDGYKFTYDPQYLKSANPLAASLTLPLQEEAYESTTLFPFFDGLIPEGWLLDAVSRNWKIDRNDRFGLLLAACRDCIGDVSMCDESYMPTEMKEVMKDLMAKRYEILH